MAGFFVYDGREFPDPDSKVSIEDVRRQLAEYVPELTNADTREEKRGDDTVYTFSKRIGTKGATSATGVDDADGLAVAPPDNTNAPRAATAGVVRVLRSVPEKRLRVFRGRRDAARSLRVGSVPSGGRNQHLPTK